jgi:ATP-dependent exoDNAse (exonuclease V) beta subunit
MTDHKATPEQWAMLEEQSAPEYDNTILELLARVEALEANSKPTPNPSQIRSSAPAGSLVERVARATYSAPSEARAAIREVAAWLQVQSKDYIASGLYWSQQLEQEAER